MTKPMILALFLSLTATAQANSGRTADGCSYRIINGQYLTSCDKPKAGPAVAASDSVTNINSAPVVTSYGNVPVRAKAFEAPAPAPTLSVQVETPSQGKMADEAQESRRHRERQKAVDSTYAGVQLGSTSIKNANSSTGLGLVLGTYLDDHFGFELGYSYTKQDLNLGLDNRENNLEKEGADLPRLSRSDASLKSHLVSGEMQGYLTDPLKRLRPYLGLGLGWKSNTLSEKTTQSYSGYGRPSGGSLSQSSLGGLGSAGAKFRIGKAFQLGLAMRYFFPLVTQDPKLEQAAGPYGQESRITRADEAVTGSSQYQIFGGVHYAF